MTARVSNEISNMTCFVVYANSSATQHVSESSFTLLSAQGSMYFAPQLTKLKTEYDVNEISKRKALRNSVTVTSSSSRNVLLVPFDEEEYCLALQSSNYFAISPDLEGFPQGARKIRDAYQQTLEFRRQYSTIQGRNYYITYDNSS